MIRKNSLCYILSRFFNHTSKEITKTLDDIRTVALSGTRTARAMGGTVSGLSKQVNLLEKELTGFTV